MKYTDRLKLAIVTDVVFVAILSTVLFLFEKNIIRSFGLWRNIWKDPTWQIAGYIILAIAIIISIFVFSGNPYASFLMFVLIMMNLLIRDIRYYRYAVKYGMDDLNDVNELANKYPEVRPMINRKQKIELENE